MPGRVYLRKSSKHRYAAILKSATKLFLKHGYTHTSMDVIAADAKVSKQTVYSYFNSKQYLFACIIEDLCAAYIPVERALENPNLTLEEGLTEIARGYMDIMSSSTCVGMHGLMIAEASRNQRIVELFYESGPKKMQALLRDYLNRSRAQNAFAIDDMECAISQFYGMLRGWYHVRMLLKLKPVPTKGELDKYAVDCVKAFCKIYTA